MQPLCLLARGTSPWSNGRRRRSGRGNACYSGCRRLRSVLYHSPWSEQVGWRACLRACGQTSRALLQHSRPAREHDCRPDVGGSPPLTSVTWCAAQLRGRASVHSGALNHTPPHQHRGRHCRPTAWACAQVGQDRQAGMQTGRQADSRQTDKQAGGQATETHRQARQAGRPAGKQEGRHRQARQFSSSPHPEHEHRGQLCPSGILDVPALCAQAGRWLIALCSGVVGRERAWAHMGASPRRQPLRQ
mmetsp:Transcript_29157/g.73319  ORF Transcript_29157/g.73319 Transcript_29157/m.73319 type:complete len:246 (-) Transcript_29157:1852-2589(-)